MFDSVGAFKKQFTPVEGGYLIYPSRRSGGKLITAEEYECLVADWKRTAGRAGIWKAVGVVTLVLVLWMLFSQALSLPEAVDSFVIGALVVALSTWMLWAGFAPRRLVKDRPALTPPRALSDAQREARGALNWRFVIFALLFSGAAFVSAVTASERSLVGWVWLVGSGSMLIGYLWIGFRKLLDLHD